MTTDSGMVYLSGLLRAGAEPLSPAAGAARRRATVPPHAARLSDHFGGDDAGPAAHAAAGHAGEGDAPAGADTEGTEAPVAVKSSEAAGGRHTHAPYVPLGEGAAESPSDDAVEVAEQHAHARIQSRPVPPSSRGVRAAFEMNTESPTPAAPVAGEARTSPADDMHGPGLRTDEIHAGETERTPVVTGQPTTAAGEGELVPASRSPLDAGRSPATPHGEPNDAAVTKSETASAVEAPPRRTSKAKAADEVVKKADEESAAPGASFLLPGASPAGGPSARRDPSAHASRASHEEGSQTYAGDRAQLSEGGAGPADAGAEPAADSAPFTLEAHVEHLRALMRTARAETPDEADAAGAARPPAVFASHRTPPLTTAARPTPEHQRAAPRTEFEARPETPTTAAHSVERQPAALSIQEPHGASPGRGTFAADARPTTPRPAPATTGGASPARVRGDETAHAQPAPGRTAGTRSVTKPSAPTVATASERVGHAPSREGTGSPAAGGGRAPKLTINRLDVQVVGRQEPPPAPPPPAPPSPPSPPHADPWGALDRELLGRFSY